MKFKRIILPLFFLSAALFIINAFSDLYVLPDLDQAKTDTEVRIEADTQDHIPPAVGMIKEIEMYGGVQKYIYAGLGIKTRGLKIGLKAYIYNDPQMKEKVGKAEIIEIYNDVVKLKIIETSYKIDPRGVVGVEVDPRFYIE